MSKKSIQKVYALTPMQEGMLYHALLDPHSSSYFTQLELRIHGSFQLELFEKSVNELIRTYDILRTVFVHQQLQKPRQVVLAERKTKVHYEDISQLDEARQTEYIERYKRSVQQQGFHLAKDILFKAAVFRLSEKELYLVWSNHHIVMDGWSMGVLMKSLFQNYEALRTGRPPGEARANLTLTISNGSEAGIMRRRNNIGAAAWRISNSRACSRAVWQQKRKTTKMKNILLSGMKSWSRRFSRPPTGIKSRGLTCFRPFGVRCSANTTIQTMWCSAPSYQAVLQKSTA